MLIFLLLSPSFYFSLSLSVCVHYISTFFDIHNDVALMEPIYLKICNTNEHASTISFNILFIKCVASVVRNSLSVGKDKGINKKIYLTRNIIRNGRKRDEELANKMKRERERKKKLPTRII